MRKHRLLVLAVAITTVLMLAGVETVAGALYYLRTGKVFYFDVRQPRQAGAYTAAEAVFHPYYSFIHRVGRDGDWWTTNNVGFQVLKKLVQAQPGCCDYPLLRGDDEVLVGIFGGSAAGGFALAAQASPEFAAQLARIPAWSGKRVRILNFAMPGFKQPQQLLALAYFLSIGQQFDLVLNIDGFNEIVTTYKNWESGVEPSFPADTVWGEWGRQLERQASTAGAMTSDRFLAGYYRAAEADWLKRSDECRLAACYELSKLASLFYQRRAKRLDAATKAREQAVTLFPTQRRLRLPEPFDVFAYTARQWAVSSRAMADLARPAGGLYLQVIQPNQWWKAAGRYEPIERDHIYKWVIDPINAGYPRLVAEVPSLSAAGVAVLDATKIFRGMPSREVYVDDCCHYTDKGNALLGAKISERIATLLSVGRPGVSELKRDKEITSRVRINRRRRRERDASFQNSLVEHASSETADAFQIR